MRLTSPLEEKRDISALFAAVSALPAAWAAAWIVAGLVIVFVLDANTGVAPVQHLYYLPIILAAARFGWRGGVGGSFVVVVLYHLANPRLFARHEEADMLQIAMFALVGPVVAKVGEDARRLRALATTDDLTGLHNLRSFEQQLTATMAAARGTGREVVLFVIDVDRLKSLNDRHGHLAGADAVRCVGRLIGETVPVEATACRYGGDEFAVVWPGGTLAAAQRLADALRTAVQSAAPVLAGQAFPAGTLSISVGVAGRARAAGDTDDARAGEALFRDADAALYAAKDRGRNVVHVAAADA